MPSSVFFTSSLPLLSEVTHTMARNLPQRPRLASTKAVRRIAEKRNSLRFHRTSGHSNLF